MSRLILLFSCLSLFPFSAHASQTLDCNSEAFFFQVHINSFGEIADIWVLTDDGRKFVFMEKEIEVIAFKWKEDLSQSEENQIHIRVKEQSNRCPRIEVKMVGSVGFIEIDGKRENLKCL